MFCLALLLIVGLTAEVSSQRCVDFSWNVCTSINPWTGCWSNERTLCPLSCNRCTRDPGCYDYNKECHRYKYLCNYHYVRAKCKQTCGFCGAVTTSWPPRPNPGTTNPTVQGDCGTPDFQGTRIIGGKLAWLGVWPWQVLLKSNGKPSCGGTIINNNWVVTASHCVVDPRSRSKKSSSSLSVVVGITESAPIGHHGQTYHVSKVISHRLFSYDHLQNDIALLKLSGSIKFTKNVKPACLPTAAARVGEECFITGWGRQSRGARNMGQRLHQARMPVISKTKCKNAMKVVEPRNVIGDSSLCAGNGDAMVSGCQGDSGGPFVCNRNNKWELHGAVSWGSQQCSEKWNQYTVFANIYNLRRWIENEMANN